MAKNNSAEKVIFLTLVDLLLQLLFLFLFAAIVISQTALSDKDWKAWVAVNAQVGPGGIDVPSFGETWRKGVEAGKKGVEAGKTEKKDGSPPKPYNDPCVPATDKDGNPTRLYIANFLIENNGIKLESYGHADADPAFSEGVNLFKKKVEESGKTTWDADHFRSAFKNFREKPCEYFVRFESDASLSNLKKYRSSVGAIRYVFGPNRTP